MAFLAVAQATHNVAQITAFYAVIGCWFIFLLAFGLREHNVRAREAKRDRTAIAGLALECIGYLIVWFPPLQRKRFAPGGSPAIGWCLAILAITMAAGSTWLVNVASRSLGKQWALAARIVEGHLLIQDGPYRFVRNPIYAGMFGMLLATGLLTTQWLALVTASVLFIIGTVVRIRSEERLLREAFGAEFETYTRNVPALIPGIY